MVSDDSGSESDQKYLQNDRRLSRDENSAKYELFFGFIRRRIIKILAFYKIMKKSISSLIDAARLLGIKGCLLDIKSIQNLKRLLKKSRFGFFFYVVP